MRKTSMTMGDEMSYLEWSRVIDELEHVIRGARLTMRINQAFLEQAVREREKFPEPERQEDLSDNNLAPGEKPLGIG